MLRVAKDLPSRLVDLPRRRNRQTREIRQ